MRWLRNQSIEASEASGSGTTCPSRSGGLLALLVLLALWLAPGAAAAEGPERTQLPDPTNGQITEDACGTAVDPAGNLYVARDTTGTVDVFRPNGDHLATINDPGGPCGLAINSAGDLYVLRTDGNVVKYEPGSFPLGGSPSWGAAEVVDSSGDARGISVDRADDRLYVARGSHVQVYETDGSTGINERQALLLINAGDQAEETYPKTGTYRLSLPGEGGPGRNETQVVTGIPSNNYTLTYDGHTTSPIAPDATSDDVEGALVALPPIGAGDVEVVGRSLSFGGHTGWWVEFTGSLAETDVSLISGSSSVVAEARSDLSASVPVDGTLNDLKQAVESLDGVGAGNVSVSGTATTRAFIEFIGSLAKEDVPNLKADRTGIPGTRGTISVTTEVAAFDGQLGAGSGDVSGVAAYSSGGFQRTRYVFVADPGNDEIDVYSATGTGSAHKLEQMLPLDSITGATSPDGTLGLGAHAAIAVDPGTGHVFSYDESNDLVNEFEATGPFLTQVSPAAAASARRGLGVDASGADSNGRLYVAAGNVGAFAPPPRASRALIPELGKKINNVGGVAVDRFGYYYVAAESSIRIFDPAGTLVNTITDPGQPRALAVDSTGVIYARRRPANREEVARYTPDSFPVTPTTSYAITTLIEGGVTPGWAFFNVRDVAVNPVDDHLFVAGGASGLSEFDDAASGNGLLDDQVIDPTIHLGGNPFSIDISSSGRIFANLGVSSVAVLSPDGDHHLRTIGFGAHAGSAGLAVDASSEHVLPGMASGGFVEEREASGSFVTRLGPFNPSPVGSEVAVDNSGGPNDGNVYVAYLNDLYVFGPLTYGEGPAVEARQPTNIGDGEATLNGTVDPNGSELTDCRFDYVTDTQYEDDGESFASAEAEPCAETLEEIGDGSDPVDVHADISGIDPSERYRFRIVAENQFDIARDDGLFGPPLHAERSPKDIHYTEAILRARLDPSGLPTSYHFEYGTAGPCSLNPCESTPERNLAPDAGQSDVEAPIFGLEEGSHYHFRLVASNDVAEIEGADQRFATYSRPSSEGCSNAQLRIGRSSKLPDCRAYELVTPGDTGGAAPAASGGLLFRTWPTSPSGPAAGGRLNFAVPGAIPGLDGTGVVDTYRAVRSAVGWRAELLSGTYPQAGGDNVTYGVAPDQETTAFGVQSTKGTLPVGLYLRTPNGIETAARGASGVDLGAFVHHLGSNGAHVIFSSAARLEDDAPPAGTRAIYDRSIDGPTSVLSLLPDGSAPTGSAAFIGANSDGDAVAFTSGGTLYLRGEGGTSEVVEWPGGNGVPPFAGISDSGRYLFYAEVEDADVNPSSLYRFDASQEAAEQIATNARFVNVSANGSTVYFTSTDQLDPPAGTAGQHNLYRWDGHAPTFVAELDSADFGERGLSSWTRAASQRGPGVNPSRTTPDGSTLVFESRAQLDQVDGDAASDIYRYSVAGDKLVCISCGSGDGGTDAKLQRLSPAGPTGEFTIIPNVADDGETVVFEADDQLSLEDQNQATDVYRWQAEGKGDCAREDGCLALISGGQGNNPSFLYAMTPDASDVFFTSRERLHPDDPSGVTSVYDARVGGGFAPKAESPRCIEDACQDPAALPPAAESPGSSTSGPSGNLAPDPPKRKDCSRIGRQAKKKFERASKAKSRKKAKRLQKQAKKLRKKARKCRASHQGAPR